jgi:hypothetical protein
MRDQVSKLVENGAPLIDAYNIDQSAYEHQDTYEFLARQRTPAASSAPWSSNDAR